MRKTSLRLMISNVAKNADGQSMTVLRACLILSTAVFFSGCGGGGGGGGATTGGGASAPTPIPTPSPVATANVSLPATQRTAAQSATSVLAVAVIDHTFASGTGPSLLSLDRHVAAVLQGNRRSVATACTNFQTLDVLASSATGETTESKIYYDAACTKIASDVVDRLTFQSHPFGVLLDATGTVYTTGGAVEFLTRIGGGIQSTTPSGIIENVTVSVATTATSAPYATVAYACTLKAATGTLAGPCSQTATIASSPSATEFGEALAFTQTLTPGSTSSTVASVGTYQLFNGPPGSIQSVTPLAPTLTGGTLIASGTLSETLTLSGALVQGSIATTDSATRLLTTVTPTTNGYAGTLARDGKTLATFTIDAFGNGTITYGDGTSGTITGFTIQ